MRREEMGKFSPQGEAPIYGESCIIYEKGPWKDPWVKEKKKKGHVFLEGYVESRDEGEELQHQQEQRQEQGGPLKTVARTKSLTDEDLDELKGCLDLGFGFSYQEIPELCNTLPALELCYSMSQRFLEDQNRSPEPSTATATCCSSPLPSPVANWKISSPGDDPDEVKARLKFWAQTVACTVKLCR